MSQAFDLNPTSGPTVEMRPHLHGWEIAFEQDAPLLEAPFPTLDAALEEAAIHARRHATQIQIYDFDGQLVDVKLFLAAGLGGEDYFVYPEGRDWLLKRRGHAGYSRYETKSEAVAAAKLLGRYTEERVHLYYRTGEPQRTIDYTH